MRAQLRSTGRRSIGEVLESGSIRIDRAARTVTVDGRPVELRRREFDLLDLLVVDVNLPRMGGIEVVEAIRESDGFRDLPIVVVSQLKDESIVRNLVRLGVSAYLLKPLREEHVVRRIGPIALARRARPSRTARGRASLRLGKGSPAMLVDGDSHYRRLFLSVASKYGPVIEAESGANALALYRQDPFDVVFVGGGTGVIGPSQLAQKLRATERGASCRLVAIQSGPLDPKSAETFDGVIGRSFLPHQLVQELRPYVRIPGPLSAVEDLVPDFAECLTTAVAQVLGMMTGLEVAQATGDHPDDGVVVSSSVTIDVNVEYKLSIDLRMPVRLAEGLTQLLGAADGDSVADEILISTVGELANMVAGRLDTWLRERGMPCHMSLPETTKGEPWQLAPPPDEGAGFTRQFSMPGHDGQLMLSVEAAATTPA